MSLLRELHAGGWLRAVDHALASSLRRLDPDTPDAVLAAAALASRAVANGHSCLRIERVAALLDEFAPDRTIPLLPSTDSWIAMLRGSPWVGVAVRAEVGGDAIGDDRFHGKPLVLERGGLFLRRYRDYEWRLANALRARAARVSTEASDALTAAWVRELFPPSDDALDLQALAALLVLSSKLTLITGGPGTGKTSTIARVLVLLAEQAVHAGRVPPRIALAAPTGKAAARLGEALRENLAGLVERGAVSSAVAALLPTDAQTLHRLLGWRQDSIDFRHNARQPLDFEVVIVDEASMVDLPLMTKLVEAVPAEARLILLGDRDQLASVETGDVLAALCDAAGDGRAFAAAFAHRASALLGADVPVAADDMRAALRGHRIDLQRSYRQASGLDLAPLATAVRDGDAATAIAGLRANRYSGVQWHARGDRGLADYLREFALPRFRALTQAADPKQALELAREYRILTGLRFGAAGSQTINASIHAELNHAALNRTLLNRSALNRPALNRSTMETAASQRPHGDRFVHGQLLIVTENSYRQKLFNGDTGVAWHDESGLRIWFDGGEGLRAWLPSQLPAHESAWALTVHKAQGSEFDRVLLVLPEHDARVLSRELLYTGITRCRHGLDIWAEETRLRSAIQRPGQRESGLLERFVLT